jgi:hypothetical protein
MGHIVDTKKREKIVRDAKAKVDSRRAMAEGLKAAVTKAEIKPVEVKAKAVKAPKAPKPEVVPTLEQAVNEMGVQLPKMPRMPRSRGPRKPKPLVPCACGCPVQTRATWAPGHDARAKGWALRLNRGICSMEQIPADERKGAQFMLDKMNETPGASIKIVKSDKGDKAVNE